MLIISAVRQEKVQSGKNCIAVSFSFTTAKKIIFGSGCLRDIGREAAALGSRPLLVTGRSFLHKTGRMDEIRGYLREHGLQVVIFDQAPPEPHLDAVEEGMAECRAHDCDLVIGIGGGSAIDVGKAIASLVRAPRPIHEYFHGREVEKKGLPFIAVPTTAGSGAEATANAVLTDAEHQVKGSIRSPHMLADVALVDPDLTLSLPPEVTAYSGMDALCQAIESHVSRTSTPLTDALSGDAAVRLIRNLPQAYEKGDDLSARTEVALGSLMGAIAFSNSRLGLVHGMAHPVGIATGLPHGLICGLLLPPVIRFNMQVSDAKYSVLARNAGLGSAVTLIAEVERLNELMGLNDRLPEIRTSEDLRHEVATKSLTAGSSSFNPRPASVEDIEGILASL